MLAHSPGSARPISRTWHADIGRVVQFRRAIRKLAPLAVGKFLNSPSRLRNKQSTVKSELLQQVLSDSPDQARISELVDELIATSVQFKEAGLGGGPWQVVYTRGPLLWQKLTASGKQQSARAEGNKAYQEFDSKSRSVINYGELLRKNLFVTATGSYMPQGQTKQTPVEIEASILKGCLHAFGRRLALPISGRGLVRVAFTDNSTVRIFQNGSGSISVQVKQSWLEQQL